MHTTPKLDLPFLLPNQAQKHVTLNTSLEMLDVLVQLSVISDTVAQQPASPDEGDTYILPSNRQGTVWEALPAGAVASFRSNAWSAQSPATGWRAWVAERAQLMVFDGASWNEILVGGTASDQPQKFGIQATADDTNRLAVSSPASLFTHAGDDHRLKINKAAISDTAALCFQTGFQGRAELGLTGDNNWHVRMQRLQSNVMPLGVTDNSALELEGGGPLGRVALVLKSVVGLTGALFEQRSDHPANIDLIDFGLKTLTHQVNLRVEGRTQFTVTGAPEFQIRDTSATSSAQQTVFAASSKQAAMRVPFQLHNVTVSALPDATTIALGAMLFVTDAADGPTVTFSDGTNWRRISDNSVVSA